MTLPTDLHTVDHVAALRALRPDSSPAVLVLGYDTPGDGGGGIFSASTDTTTPDNGGTLIAMSSGRTGCWRRLFSGPVDARWFGAKGDGVEDDTAALLRAAAVQNLVFSPGTYVVSASVVFAGTVAMLRGAVLQLAVGVTATFSGGFAADVYRVFAGAGAVVLNRALVREGYPEWWGALTGGADCLAALQAAIVALPIVQLQAADYFISNTLNIATSHVALCGVSKRWGGANQATRIVVRSSTADTIFIGTVARPRDVNSFLQQVEIRNLDVTRAAPVAPPSAGSEISGAAGIRMQLTLFTYIEQVNSSEHTLGFVLNGTVRTHMKDCLAFRSQPGMSSSNDVFIGYLLNGNADIGLAGGNASTYLTDCTAGTGGIAQSPTFASPGGRALTDSTGFALAGAPVDTFLLRPEASVVNNGIAIAGDASQAGNADVHIINPVLDQFGLHGLLISGVGNYGAISVVSGYYAPAGTSTAFCMRVMNSTGMTALTNNQCITWGNPLALGLSIENSSGVVAKSNMYLGARRAITLIRATNCEISDVIHNPRETASQAAVLLLDSSSRNRIAPIVKGMAGAFPQGIALSGASNSFNELTCTGVDPACIVGGSADKLLINGVSVVVTGLTGNNLASGIML